MSEPLKLGQIIEGEQQRDAIHVAVYPVTAAQVLAPGQPIGFIDEGKSNVGITPKPIGIVDPFLTRLICAGEQFWMFLYPNTITSLRHDWTHPAFEAEPVAGSKAESEAWLKDFADEVGVSYARLIDGARSCLAGGDDIQTNTDLGDRIWTDREKLWKHFEIVTGEKVPDDKREETFFSCAC